MQVQLKLITGRILIVLLMLFFTSSALVADEVSEIRAMTKEKVDIVINILKNKSLSKEEKKEGILETIDGLFDFNLMFTFYLKLFGSYCIFKYTCVFAI